MDDILAWPLLLWLSRVLAVLGVGGATLVVALGVGRLLRPTTMRAILFGELPALKRFKMFGQELEFLGQSVEEGEVLETRRDEQFRALERRVENLVEVVDANGATLQDLVNEPTEDRDVKQEGTEVGNEESAAARHGSDASGA